MALYGMTMQDVLCKHALGRAGETAFVSEKGQWSFGQFHNDIERLASGLMDLGLGKESRIAVMAFNCYEFFLLYGAAALLGAIIIPMNWRLKPEEIEHILEDCAPAVALASQALAPNMAQVLDRCSSAPRRIVIGKATNGFVPFDEIMRTAPGFEAVSVTPQDPLVIMYTAAVWGRPRGAVLTHENLVAAGLQVMAPLKLYYDAVYVNLMPLFHVMGLQMALGVLHAGGRNVITERFDAAQAVDVIDREQATVIAVVPPMLSSLLDNCGDSHSSLKSLRVVASLFDSPETIQRCIDATSAEFWSGYGQTETSGYVSLSPYTERPGSSGREGPMARIRVANESHRASATDQPGEILVKGPVTFRGYWKAGATINGAPNDGWHHTGDIGRLDDLGYLWYEKRKADKDLIKTGGENVYPAEVENVLLEHGDIQEACVFGVPDATWGESIRAVCVRRPGGTVSSRELIELVGARLAGYKKPKSVLFVDSLPTIDNGTVDRERVKNLTLETIKWTETS